MKRIILSLILFPTFVHAQALTTTFSIKHTYGQIWLTDDPCNYVVLTVDRIEELNKPIRTELGYEVKNCDGTYFAFQGMTTINNAGFTIDNRNKVYRLEISNPIKISITWKFPTEFRQVEEHTNRREKEGEITLYENKVETLGLNMTGSIGGRLFAPATEATITLITETTKESK